TSGGPALAKGGSGDVLTGVLAACTSQFGTSDWLRVLALGVFLHGTAADILAREKSSSGILATEVAEAIPDARENLLREIQFGGGGDGDGDASRRRDDGVGKGIRREVETAAAAATLRRSRERKDHFNQRYRQRPRRGAGRRGYQPDVHAAACL